MHALSWCNDQQPRGALANVTRRELQKNTIKRARKLGGSWTVATPSTRQVKSPLERRAPFRYC